MELFHHIAFNQLTGVEDTINRMGIRYSKTIEPGPGFVASFEIAESDPCWTAVAELVRGKNLLDFPYTTFTQEEVLAAEWLRLQVMNERGYPQPERGNKWKIVSYENGCPKCGIGLIQKASLHIAKEPKLGKSGFMQPYWTAAVFVTFEVRNVLRSVALTGYEEWPVIIHSEGRPSDTVTQLYVAKQSSPGLLGTNELKEEVCRACGQLKFNAVQRGRLKYQRAALPLELDFVRSREWFGSGGFAFQETFVSRRVARIIVDQGWRGVELHPLELV